ncbi:MAG: hypothetical protein WAK69_16795, partial [Rhodoplanes sp.]
RLVVHVQQPLLVGRQRRLVEQARLELEAAAGYAPASGSNPKAFSAYRFSFNETIFKREHT